MRVVLVIAGKEVREGLRNRWVVAATLLLAALALALAFLGSAPTGTVGASPLAVTVVSLSSLSIYLVPLIALLLAFDAVAGEVERGTMALLLACPVLRWQVILGKFLGHTAILAFATAVGYACGGLAAALGGPEGGSGQWGAFAAMIGSSILLGAAFVAIGQLASVLVRERSTAAGVAIGVWVFFVLLYDMTLLGVLAADKGETISGAMFQVLLLMNPADTYRLFNLAGFESVRAFSGLAGLSEYGVLGPASLLAVMVAWIAVPLLLAGLAFQRREL